MIQYWQFAKLSVDGTQVVQLINRGGTYKNTSFGLNSPDQSYIDAGLIPVVGDGISHNEETQTRTMTYNITPTLITRVYTIENKPLDELKVIIKAKVSEEFKANTRPRVSVTLDDDSVIEVDGGREDKDNFKEKHASMVRLSQTTSTIKDADDNYHACTLADMERCYFNIVDAFDASLATKWAKDIAIDSCTTYEELVSVEI